MVALVEVCCSFDLAVEAAVVCWEAEAGVEEIDSSVAAVEAAS